MTFNNQTNTGAKMYQKLIIIGNLGSNPEQRFTPSGDPVTSFSVATSRKYGEKDETTWFRVTVWGKQAESCSKYLSKGSKVLVEGRLKSNADGNPRVYERKDGTWASSYELTAESVRFLTAKGEQVESADLDVPF
jgi:single-strand DNA-binding protein